MHSTTVIVHMSKNIYSLLRTTEFLSKRQETQKTDYAFHIFYSIEVARKAERGRVRERDKKCEKNI